MDPLQYLLLLLINLCNLGLGLYAIQQRRAQYKLAKKAQKLAKHGGKKK